MFKKTNQEAMSFRTLALSNGKLEFRKEKLKITGDPQLVVRPLLVGVCRSDIKEFLGTRSVRHDFGHEILAKVVDNNDPRLPAVDSIVVLDPHVKINRSSGFGELIVASSNVTSLLKAFSVVPSSAKKDRFVFTEPLACAHHCVANLMKYKLRNNLKGLTIGVLGAGMAGTLIASLCKHYGADVTLINRSKERLDFLESISFFNKETLCLSEDIDKEFDVVIPATTFLLPPVLRFCSEIVKKDGLVLLYGGTKAGDKLPGQNEVDVDKIRRSEGSQVVNSVKRFRVCGTHGASYDDFKIVIDLLSKPNVDLPVEKLITRRIYLDEVPKIIAQMAQEESFGKTIVIFDKTKKDYTNE